MVLPDCGSFPPRTVTTILSHAHLLKEINLESEIRENKKQCTCFSCQTQVPKGFNMLHLDKWGSRWTLCLECVVILGDKAKEMIKKENRR